MLTFKLKMEIPAQSLCVRATRNIVFWRTWIFISADALAGIHEGGNVVEDVHFFGGTHAVWTSKPSPGWQFTLIDCSFEGQRESAIFEHEAGLTLIRPQFQNVPTAVEIETNWADELWVKDARLENISGPAFVFGMEKSPRTEINLEGINCRNVPIFAALQDSGKHFDAPSKIYSVKNFSHGLDFADIGTVPEIETHFDAQPLTRNAGAGCFRFGSVCLLATPG